MRGKEEPFYLLRVVSPIWIWAVRLESVVCGAKFRSGFRTKNGVDDAGVRMGFVKLQKDRSKGPPGCLSIRTIIYSSLNSFTERAVSTFSFIVDESVKISDEHASSSSQLCAEQILLISTRIRWC